MLPKEPTSPQQSTIDGDDSDQDDNVTVMVKTQAECKKRPMPVLPGKEIRRRLEIQMRIEEENRRIETADVVQESRTVQHFQGDNAETESSSLTPQQALALSAEAEPSPSTLSSATATTAQTGSSYHSNIQQCNSSSQTMSVGDEPSPATSDSLLLDATSPVTMQGVRPKVLYKASVATDTEDFTDPSTSSPLSDSQQDRQERHRIFTNAKAQSFDHPRPAFLQPKGAQPVVKGTRIGNLIRTLSKTSLQNTEPEGRLYRSHSRSSLHSDMSDASPMRRGIARHGSLAEFDRPFGLESNRKDDDASSLVGATSSSYISEGRKQDYYLSLEELVQQRKQEQMRTQGLELVRLIREAEQRGFTADDLQVAMNHCGNDNPINWLRDNWQNMTETVVTLATNYGHDRRENTIGIVSVSEAQNALRHQKGNIWAAVTECVENRQRMAHGPTTFSPPSEMQPPQPGFDPATCGSAAEYLSYTTAAERKGGSRMTGGLCPPSKRGAVPSRDDDMCSSLLGKDGGGGRKTPR
ncbi:hypothetical protein HPB51_017367 [Rhipicephalus microplus]|uniref:E3 ubiquitin-protein ligase RNF31 UBA-like domain-containing protein n=1 Tax=Rhipicephalus microplus TaxID=6941 RepID=A0A9J6DAK2_RHIMP|nr:hypothetical protein HPB51_017367 [Rhipicephalus microplus]